MPRVTFQCNQSFVSHVSEILFYYKSKSLTLRQTLIKASQHHQKWKKLISRTCDKYFLWELVGLSRMLPVTFQRNPTQINRCKKKFFLANHYFRPQITGGRACRFACWIFFNTNLKFWSSFKPMIIYRSAKGEVLKNKFLVVCS